MLLWALKNSGARQWGKNLILRDSRTVINQPSTQMGRLHFTDNLSDEQLAALDACIIEHRYCHLGRIKEALSQQGIQIGRSTLHRHVQVLKARKDEMHVSSNQTLVTVMDRASGKFAVKVVNASAASVEEALSKI